MRNALFSVTQIAVSTIVLFWMYRRSTIITGLTGLGTWSLTTGLVSLLTVADLGLTDAMVRQVARYRAAHDWLGVRRVIVSCSCYVGVAILVFGMALHPVIAGYLETIVHQGDANLGLLTSSSIVVLVINTISLGLLGAIEGFERYEHRLLVGVTGNVVLIASSYYFLSRFGALGISLCFLMQSVTTLAVAALVLKQLIPEPQNLGPIFSFAEIRRMSRLGIPIRAGSLVNLTYEPITRLLVAKFGGIESAGIYEASVRCGIQGKAIIVACTQVVVPRLSALAMSGSAAIATLLQFAYRVTGLLVIAALPLILLSSPLISYVLLGRVNVQFQLFTEILSTGWILNSLAAPASFANLAEGRIFWNWFSNASAALINPAIGLLLGPLFGVKGVIIGSSIALLSMALILVVTRKLRSNDPIPRPGPAVNSLLVLALTFLIAQHVVTLSFAGSAAILATSFSLTFAFALVWVCIALKSIQRIVDDAGIA
jgi:O-antigen/teichoic acid export membrane protein